MIAFSPNKNGETYHTYGYTNAGWSDLLTSFDGGTITYDAIGNPLTYHDGKTFTWTAGRKLSTVTDGSNTYTYTYDGDGNRISKTAYGETTDYYYIDGKLLGLKKGQDTLLFLYDETDTAYGFLHNGTPYYYAFNLQGDIVAIRNEIGMEMASYSYDVWGNPVSISDNYYMGLATLNPLRYRGYFYDEETGFYYLQSRYYDSEVGRFISSDGYVSTGQGILSYNQFAYCLNNPVRFSDDSGSRCVEDGPNSRWVMVTNSGNVVSGGPPTSNVGAAKPYVDMPGSSDPTSPNCYAYAIGSPVNEQPGGTSGRIPQKWNDVNDVGESVEADLRAKGYTVRKISSPDAKVHDNEFKIAFRVGTKPLRYKQYLFYDYHFMRQTDTGQWAEKHGTGGASILWDVGMTPDTIPWTANGEPYYDSEIIYYAVGN